MKDFNLIMDPKNPIKWCDVELIDDNIREWNAYIYGPPGTGYEGGIFQVHCNWTGPYDCSEFTMKTEIYHMNISFHGKICLKYMDDPDLYDPIKDGALVILEEIYELMKKPDPTAVLNERAFALYFLDEKEYHLTTKVFTDDYAPKQEKKNINGNNDNVNNDEKKDDPGVDEDKKQDDKKQDDKKEN